MAKCKLCGKKGLFLKVDEKSVCKDCTRLQSIKDEEDKTLKSIEQYTSVLSDKVALYKKFQDDALSQIQHDIDKKNNTLTSLINETAQIATKLNATNEDLSKQTKSLLTLSNKALKLKNVSKSLQHVIEKYYHDSSYCQEVNFPIIDNEIISNLSPVIELELHCLSLKDLRKRFNDNKLAIKDLLEQYKSRYTTKANATIYQLIVLGIEAELQNILYSLKSAKLDSSLNLVHSLIAKYMQIATEGSQSIANTVIKFLGQLEHFYFEAVKIEYEYFVQKEKIKDEQRMLREQMRQEAEERKLLEQQKKQIEAEESKYHSEISALQKSLENSQDDIKTQQLNERIHKLELMLSEVSVKKDEILNLQHGKAGYVYVISNLGSFGNDVFKIGMTRRLEPQERIDELGSASVPFPFDVHSFIFSNNAVELENNIHKLLNFNRVNKINMRKEFFKTSIDELEKLVRDLEPTAEFNLTMLAEQYKQSISIPNEMINYDFTEYTEDDAETALENNN